VVDSHFTANVAPCGALADLIVLSGNALENIGVPQDAANDARRAHREKSDALDRAPLIACENSRSL
jgi:hypothetical protein